MMGSAPRGRRSRTHAPSSGRAIQSSSGESPLLHPSLPGCNRDGRGASRPVSRRDPPAAASASSSWLPKRQRPQATPPIAPQLSSGSHAANNSPGSSAVGQESPAAPTRWLPPGTCTGVPRNGPRRSWQTNSPATAEQRSCLSSGSRPAVRARQLAPNGSLHPREQAVHPLAYHGTQRALPPQDRGRTPATGPHRRARSSRDRGN